LRTKVKVGALVGAASALAIAVPAAAHPGKSSHPDKSDHPSASHPSQSHQCKPHNLAYTESGTVDKASGSTLAANPDGTWSGTLVVDVAKSNHSARANKGTTVTYTFTNAKLRVRFDRGASGFAAGDHVKLIGKLASVSRKCTALTPAPAPVFRMIVVHASA
jgi:hypothetical protein